MCRRQRCEAESGGAPVVTSPHVDGLDSQPHRVDANHRSSSRIQAAQSLATFAGHVAVIDMALRRLGASAFRCACTGAVP
jgi:hypothetical protein